MGIRTVIAGTALAGCAVLAAGCSQSPGTSAGTSGSATSKQAAVLVAAALPLHTMSYKFTTDAGGVNVQGAADPKTNTVALTTATSVDVVVVGQDLYLKYPKGAAGMPAVPAGKWVHVDTTKVSATKLGVPNVGNPAANAGYLAAAKSVQKVDSRHYKGVLDLSQAGADPKLVESLGAAAKSVPFDVTMDGDGRLATLDLTLTVNARPVTTHTRFSDYGAAVTATKPAAASVVEAPDSFYRVFNH